VQRDEIEVPSTEEIYDKSKTGVLITAFTLIQGLWFVTQCIARGIQSLHVTKLEILTAAYVMMTVGMHLTWWDKPRLVDQPIRVPQPLNRSANAPLNTPKVDKVEEWFGTVASIIFASEDVASSDLVKLKQVPMFYAGDSEDRRAFDAWCISWFVGAVFSGILCITWSYPASSLAELVIWRLCSLSGIAFFIFFLGCALLYDYLDNLDIGRWGFNSEGSEAVVGLFALFLVLAYVTARVVTIYLAVKDLTRSPSETFEVVYWTDFIPHI
jgi:hypothetical protein